MTPERGRTGPGANGGSVTDQGGSGGDAQPDPNQPPSWSPVQPPTSGGGYGTPPGQPAAPAAAATYGRRPMGSRHLPPSMGSRPTAIAPPAYGYGRPAAPKPGIIPLRPLVFSEILDGGIQAIRSNPRMLLWTAVGLLGVLVAMGLSVGLSLAATASSADSQALNVLGQFAGSGAQILVELIAICGQTLLAGVVVVSVSESVLGRQATFKQTWARVRPRFWRLLGYTLLSSLGIAAGTVCCILPGYALMAFWALGAPALVLEATGVFAAFSRSWRLVSGSFWRVLGIVVVTGLLAQVIAGAVAAVCAGIGALIGWIFGTTGAIIGAIVARRHRTRRRAHRHHDVLGVGLRDPLRRHADASRGAGHRPGPGRRRLAGRLRPADPARQCCSRRRSRASATCPSASAATTPEDAATRELIKPIYHRDDPTLLRPRDGAGSADSSDGSSPRR